MQQNSKLIISFGMAIMAIILLVAGLSNVELRTGDVRSADILAELRLLVERFGIFRGGLVVLYVLSPFILLFIARRINKTVPIRMEIIPRKRRSWYVILIQSIMWAIAILIIRDRLGNGRNLFAPVEFGNETSVTPYDEAQVASVSIPDWFTYLISFLIIILVLYAFWFIFRRMTTSSDTLKIVAKEAQSSLDELQAGEEFSDVIVKCYFQMSRALDQNRSVRRKQGMTPREFESSLIKMGMPEEPVRQLTRLFEAVRYGAKRLDQSAEQQAVSSLESIIRAIREAP